MARLKFEFSGGEVFIARILDSLAPKTSSIVLRHLPLNAKVVHTMFSGHVMLVETKFRFDELENPRVIGIKPGDVLFNTHTAARIKRETGEFVPPEIMIGYGPLIHPKGSCGDELVNHFAVIEGDLSGLKTVGKRVRENCETVAMSSVRD